jgi:hypothetical protein
VSRGTIGAAQATVTERGVSFVVNCNGFGVVWHLFAAIVEFQVLSHEIPTNDCPQSGVVAA